MGRWQKYMKEKSPNLMKTINLEIQKAKRMPRTRNMKKHKPGLIIIRLLKIDDKEKIWKVPRGEKKRHFTTEE